MNIAIVGCRGIPNNYGGFEQFAEHLSVELARRGNCVSVYNPHFHPYREAEYHGVRIVRRFSPERQLGAVANFLFDLLSLRHALRDGNDVVLELGYGTAAPALALCRRRETRIITNMDGLEWKRDKWSPWVQRLMRRMEALAVWRSDYLVADNPGIQEYLEGEYGAESTMIPYGTEVFESPNDYALEPLGLEPRRFSLVIARLVPENNVDQILEGHRSSGDGDPLVVIGNVDNGHGRDLARRYGCGNVRFPGTIFDRDALDNLRAFSKVYFHGHSVGGTNPSLLEAMAAGALVAAHDNPFNRTVLEDGGVYFDSAAKVSAILAGADRLQERRPQMVEANRERIRTTYSWDRIADQYETLFRQTGSPRGGGARPRIGRDAHAA